MPKGIYPGNKGRTPHNKGKVNLSALTRQKFKVVCPSCDKERVLSYETFRRIKKGESTSKCHGCGAGRYNEGTFKKGLIPWNTNRPWTEEERSKMKLSQQKRISQPGYKAWNKGMRSLDAVSNRKLRDEIERLLEYKEWRKGILKRDNYTCSVPECDEKKSLHVHHLNELKNIIRLYNIKTLEDALNCPLLWKQSNGIALCHRHHKNAHKKNFNNLTKMVWNNREEFENFYKQYGCLHLIQ